MNQWTNGSATQWINESVNQWSNDQKIQWVSERGHQWINASLNQGSSESTIRRFNESPMIHQWINESTVQRLSESMNQWTTESLNQRINERVKWVNESRKMNQWISKSFPQNRKLKHHIEPYFGDPWSHITRKKTPGFAPESACHPWIHTLPNCYTSQLLDDDVVDMTMGLVWWCGWHDAWVYMMWLTWWCEC